MSVAPPPAAAPSSPPPAPQTGEACPLCRTPLQPEQEWCLHCGAAARTRLAASPSWRAPIVALLAVLVISLGVLAGSLVKLAGPSQPAVTNTTTVTTQAAATTATQTTQLPATTTGKSLAPGKTTGGLATTPTVTTSKPSSQALEKETKRLKTTIPGLKKSIAERLAKLGLQSHAKK